MENMENMENKENDNLENFKIEDDVLEDVSGGTSRRRDIYYCYYCHTRHALMRQYPWRIRPAGYKKMVDACRYDCEKNGPFFTIETEGGRTEYFNAHLMRLH